MDGQAIISIKDGEMGQNKMLSPTAVWGFTKNFISTPFFFLDG